MEVRKNNMMFEPKNWERFYAAVSNVMKEGVSWPPSFYQIRPHGLVIQWRGCAAALAIGLALSACANLNTVGRKTPLSGDVAVHLDAQQRAIIRTSDTSVDETTTKRTTTSRYCAEPSPDALAAYAATLQLGTSSDSASTDLSSVAANIGLRTQSIQLMRDALYRLCEARNNKDISAGQMAMFLRRNQDLTAVIVAVEQLTGAVVARQVIVNASARSNNHSALVAGQKLLTEMEDRVEKHKITVEETQEQVDAETNESAKARIQQTLETQKQLLEYAKKVHNEFRSFLKALSDSSANTDTSEQFGQPHQMKTLDSETSGKVAVAVAEMVNNVLKKDYIIDYCMILLKEEDVLLKEICKDIMLQSAEAALLAQIPGPTNTSKKLTCLADEGIITSQQTTDWLKSISEDSNFNDVQLRLRDSMRAEELRNSYVKHLKSSGRVEELKKCGL